MTLAYQSAGGYVLWLWKKGISYDPDSHDDVITNLEPDILECEVKHHYEQS